jgi:hypothetical protein
MPVSASRGTDSPDQHVAAGQSDIGSYHAAQRQPDDVAGDELDGRDGFPRPVAFHRRVHRQPRSQRGQRVLCTVLLKQAQRGVEQQQAGNDRSLYVAAHDQLEQGRRLKHPRHR